MQTELDRMVRALQGIRMPAEPGEYDIHLAVAEALETAGLEPRHEVRLAPRCRIDFVVGRVGIEIKKGRPDAKRLQAQLARYLESAELDSAVAVTQRAVPIPDRIGGKPVRLVSLDRLWGVALP